jgi:antitoxin (DNA-binding transcriptional repressor) of toxin-antitoxin stability system
MTKSFRDGARIQVRTHLSRLLERVSLGEEITILEAGMPVARLIPAERPPRGRQLGWAVGEIIARADFDDPLPEEIEESFYR